MPVLHQDGATTRAGEYGDRNKMVSEARSHDLISRALRT
jgi:hypothetical protein